jgi:hypothetical protein
MRQPTSRGRQATRGRGGTGVGACPSFGTVPFPREGRTARTGRWSLILGVRTRVIGSVARTWSSIAVLLGSSMIDNARGRRGA